MKNNFFNIHDLILVLTAFEALMLCIVLKFLPGKNKQPSNILAFFFLLIACTLVTTMLIWNSCLRTSAIDINIIPTLVLSCCALLQGPTLYFYLRSLSENVLLWHWQSLIHLLPAIIVSMVIIGFDVRIEQLMSWGHSTFEPGRLQVILFILTVVKCSQLMYISVCLFRQYHLRQQMKLFYSAISIYELRLADLVLGGFFLVWLWSFIAYFLGPYISLALNDLLGILNNYLTVILVNSLFVLGFRNARDLLGLSVNVPFEVQKKTTKFREMDEKIAAIENAIHRDKLYLEKNLHLEQFAEQIGMSSKEVSSILNTHYKSNFFEFINGHRVIEAKRLWEASDDDSILDVLYKSGFNSQSAFHRFFKRLVGVTPSQYRQQLQRNAAAQEQESKN